MTSLSSNTVRTAVMTGPLAASVIDADLPPLGPRDVLIENLYSGISAGTEMNFYRGLAPQLSHHQDPTTGLFTAVDGSPMVYPFAYGYAAVGRVREIGPAVEGLEPGQLVFSYSSHSTASVVSFSEVVALPELADPRVGVLNANLNTALNGVLDAHPNYGDVVVVSGLGTIGMLAVAILSRMGVTIYGIDAVPERRALAERYGATSTFAPGPDVAAVIRGLTGNRGADIVIEASGASPALNEAIRIVGYCGTVIALSWYGGTFESLNLSREFHHLRPRIVATQVGGLAPHLGPLWSMPRRQGLVSDLLATLDLVPLMTHEFDIEDAADAYACVHSRPDDLVQCLIRYPLVARGSLDLPPDDR
jgi:2-desacetyl-2-hydroxyethyl bacteriochlorophyllide A dehydrogenase